MPYSDYVVFVDESGDHGLVSIDSDYPVFVLDFCVFRKEDYIQRVVPKVEAFKVRALRSRSCRAARTRLATTYLRPNSPYELALTFCMERTYGLLRAQGQHTLKTHVVVERRGKREDDALELAFRRICDGDNQQGPMPGFEIIFADKKSNSAGLQLADLTARPIGRHVLNPAQPNRAWDIVQGKLYRRGPWRVMGWGLKIFPPLKKRKAPGNP